MFFIRNIRAVIISALAIPASIISSFTLMRVMGFTLNNMTLLGITLAVGIVIDDAIVVLENIFRYIEEKNCTPFEAAIQGTREVALAVMATTLSLVVIFLPIAFMNGYAKRFINPFGWTMAFAIMVSMLVSFTLTPMLSSRFLKLSDARGRSQDQGARLLPLARQLVHAAGELGARSLRRRSSRISVVTFAADVPAEPDGRPRVRAERGHGRVDDPRRRARRHVARGHDARWRSSCSKELSGIEGVAQIEPSIGVVGQRGSPTHIHFLCQALPIDERKNTQAQIITEMRQAAGGAPELPAEHQLAQRAGQRRRAPAGSRSRPTSSAPT